MAWPLFTHDGVNAVNLYDAAGDPLARAFNIDKTEYRQDDSLRIYNFMTYNVQNWTDYNANAAVIEAMFRQYAPVVVGLQECRTNGGYVPDVFPRSYPSTDGSMLMLFSSVEVSDFVSVPFTDNQGQFRAYQKGTISLDGKTITVFNTHVEYSPNATRIAQLQELVQQFALCDSFICFGDFNLGLHANYGDQYENFIKPLIDAGYHSANWFPKTGYVDTYFSGATIEASGEKYPCDSIITSADLQIFSIEYDTQKIVAGQGTNVDHIPVITSIGFFVEEASA